MLTPLFAFDLGLYQGYLPYAVGLGVAAVGFGLATAATRGRRRPFGPPGGPAGEPADDWATPSRAVADRRASLRREGAPVKVFLLAPAFHGRAHDGWVLDRSTGGLRLAVAAPLPPGTAVQVRAENAPDTIPWVTVIVRSSKRVDDHHELGCSFEQTPPWNVLLLFG